MMRNLTGRRLLLTGASRGIGRCLAEQAAGLGARLVLTARSHEELEKLAATLRAGGADVHAVAADITSPDDRDRLVREAVGRLGGLDVLINNAGVASFGHFDTSSEEILRRIMEVNFFAPAELMRLCVRHLARGVQPAVVNIGSVCGRLGLPGWPEHCASKFALIGLSEALRGEFARFDVDVLVVLPGLVKCDDLGRHLLRNEGRMKLNFAGAQPPEKAARGILRAIQKNRAETVIGFKAWWLLLAQKFYPFIVSRVLAYKVRKLYPRPGAATPRL